MINRIALVSWICLSVFSSMVFGALSESTPDYLQASRQFFASSNYLNTNQTTERAYLLIRNPASSGHTCRVRRVIFAAPASGSSIYKIYFGPNVSNNGTAVTVVKGSSTAPANNCLVTSLPTVSVNGNIFRSLSVSTSSASFDDEFNYGLWIAPGESVLFTVTQSLVGQAGSVNIEWGE